MACNAAADGGYFSKNLNCSCVLCSGAESLVSFRDVQASHLAENISESLQWNDNFG